MTKVNVHFGSPESYYGLELDPQSEAAYRRWVEASENGDLVADDEWDAFMDEFHRQVRPMMGSRGYVEEVYEVAD